MTETVEQRAECIFARLEAEHGPGERLFAAVVCDACGYTVKTASVAVLARLTADWALREHDDEPDLCPNCLHGHAPCGCHYGGNHACGQPGHNPDPLTGFLVRVTEDDGGSRAKGSTA